jgi:hypothetical protein
MARAEENEFWSACHPFREAQSGQIPSICLSAKKAQSGKMHEQCQEVPDFPAAPITEMMAIYMVAKQGQNCPILLVK